MSSLWSFGKPGLGELVADLGAHVVVSSVSTAPGSIRPDPHVALGHLLAQRLAEHAPRPGPVLAAGGDGDLRPALRQGAGGRLADAALAPVTSATVPSSLQTHPHVLLIVTLAASRYGLAAERRLHRELAAWTLKVTVALPDLPTVTVFLASAWRCA